MDGDDHDRSEQIASADAPIARGSIWGVAAVVLLVLVVAFAASRQSHPASKAAPAPVLPLPSTTATATVGSVRCSSNRCPSAPACIVNVG